MKRLVMWWVVGSLLTGCATATPDPWDRLQQDETPAVKPYPLPDPCLPSAVEDERIVFDRTGVECLDRYYTIAEGNTDIAGALSSQVDSLKQANNELIQAGQAQRQVADLRQEIIIEERRQHWLEKAGLYAIILVGIGAASL